MNYNTLEIDLTNLETWSIDGLQKFLQDLNNSEILQTQNDFSTRSNFV